MADSPALERLGGGRWQTRDGRFTVEPQSGTWVVVDGERTNELGLPLVRGPFTTLTAAKADIEVARSEGEADSPLASRLAATRKRRARTKMPAEDEKERPGTPATTSMEPSPARERAPKEPAWLRSLDAPRRSAARKLIERLAEDGVADAEAVVRSDVVGDKPAVARVAIERRIAEVVGRKDDPDAVARAVTEVLLEGQDRDLGVRWRLVDGDGRAVRSLDLARRGRR